MVALQHTIVTRERQRARDWLRYIYNQGEDLGWLSAYENELVGVLRRGIYTPSEFKDAIHLLIKVFPYFITTRLHTEIWLPILISALVQAQDLKNNDLQARLSCCLGETYLKSGKHRSSHASFQLALERAAEGKTDELIVAAYTGLFRLQWFDREHLLNQTLVKHALEVTQRLDKSALALSAALHDALAFAYVQVGDTAQAIGHAQTAYFQSLRTGIPNDIGHAAYTTAMCYRVAALFSQVKHCLTQADYFLTQARSILAQTDQKWQHVLLTYEQGILYLQSKDYEAAEQWLTLTLAEAQGLGILYHIAIAHHALGLVQTSLKKFDDARESLQQALGLWKEMNNIFEHLSLLQALGYLEGLAGNKEIALHHLTTAEEACQKLDPTTFRALLLARIRGSIVELND